MFGIIMEMLVCINNTFDFSLLKVAFILVLIHIQIVGHISVFEVNC